ncbi:MAG: bifunctional UDP-N-acetylglucosamine diphosphorylase/glucosamine-1-phosphate N-acetyltransferase GlmU [Leptospirales bacterium]
MIIDGVLLAAGSGTRMRSPVPKVLSPVLGAPLLSYPYRALVRLHERVGAVHVVVPPGGLPGDRPLEAPGSPPPLYVVQERPDGTFGACEAVISSSAFLSGSSTHLLVLNGDGPLVDETLLESLVSLGEDRPGALVLTTAHLDDPTGYGRILRDPSGRVFAIREESAASASEKAIGEVNAGIYLIPRPILLEAAGRIAPDPRKGERYLTDLVARVVAQAGEVLTLSVSPEAMRGVNTQEELSLVTAVLRERINRLHMGRGVTLQDPLRTDIGPEVEIGPGTVILPQSFLEGRTRVGSSCRIGLGVHLLDTEVGDGAVLRDYVVASSAVIGPKAVVGPFAHLRPGTELGLEVHIGNFVETKKAVLGPGAKANHLSYLGDVTVGARTNIGAGTITCNYDGYEKFETVIGEDVFVGSDSQLVAPLSVGDGAVIAAGSTVVADLPPGALYLTRPSPELRPEGALRYHERRRERRKKNKRKESS